MIEQSFTTGTVVPRWVRTVEPLSSTAHRQEPKTIEAIAHHQVDTALAQDFGQDPFARSTTLLRGFAPSREVGSRINQ